MELKPAATYVQKSPALQRHVTRFKWVLPDWSQLYDSTYSKGLKSDFFRLEGLDQCTCQLYLNLMDPTSHIHVLYSDSQSILRVSVKIEINEKDSDTFSASQPIGKIRRLGILLSLKKKKFTHVLRVDSSDEVDDTLTIAATFVITKCPEPLLLKNLTTNVLKKMEALFNDKELCDVTFVLSDREIPAHRVVVAAHSQVFKAMFSSEMTESKKKRVEIIDIDATVFQKFLRYLYTENVNDLKESVQEMIIVADKYQVEELRAWCINYMIQNLSVENVVQFILIADKLNCPKLKKKALKFLNNNPTVFVEVIKEGNPEVSTGLQKILSDLSKQ